MKITTIRHGETDWNVAKRLQGSVDIELNQVGLDQAHKLAKRLSGEPCDIIYSSDLLRAKKTAEIINTCHNVPLITSQSLRESGFGEFEGQSIADPKVYAAFGKFMEEHVHVLFNRVHEYIDEILKNDHENIFIVSHYGAIVAILCRLMNVPPEERLIFTIGNTAIHTLERTDNGEFRMFVENDTSHLD